MGVSNGEFFLLIFIIIVGTFNLVILLYVLKEIKKLLNKIITKEDKLLSEEESLVRSVKPKHHFRSKGLERNERSR